MKAEQKAKSMPRELVICKNLATYKWLLTKLFGIVKKSCIGSYKHSTRFVGYYNNKYW